MLTIIAIGGISFFSYKIAKKNQIKNIINDLESKYDQQKYQECIVAVESKETRQAGVPEEKITELIGKCRLEAAKEQANSLNFSEVIAIAIKIPEDSLNYQDVQKNIDLWSNKILEDANDIYNEEAERRAREETLREEAERRLEEAGRRTQEERRLEEALREEALREEALREEAERRLEEALREEAGRRTQEERRLEEAGRRPNSMHAPGMGKPGNTNARPRFGIPDNTNSRPSHSIGAGTRATEDECSDSSFESLCDE